MTSSILAFLLPIGIDNSKLSHKSVGRASKIPAISSGVSTGFVIGCVEIEASCDRAECTSCKRLEILRETLVKPNIIPPVASNEISKPHMSKFVRYYARPQFSIAPIEKSGIPIKSSLAYLPYAATSGLPHTLKVTFSGSTADLNLETTNATKYFLYLKIILRDMQ
ncbi:hypothetical protein ALC53_05577 [Atta colombica]|uniref:Uncharacterized protein n=1 Tax=Atta colombica TaxID=520822 RepID=A0A195BIT4_9HYME|nr:hypothetical protein ALC53_05577 [Atta colombica]